jgi:hypothetical protein
LDKYDFHPASEKRRVTMNSSRLEKYAPLSGAASVLLLIIATGLLGVYDYLPGSDKLVEIFSGNSTNTVVVGYLGLFSAALIIWFAGSVYATLKEREGGTGRISMIAFAGCVASGITLGTGFSAVLTIGARAGGVDGISAAEAVTLYDLYGTLLGQMAAFTFAVLIGATAAVSLRTAMFPSWFGWASVIIALGLVSPIGYFALAFVLIWIVGVSITFYRQ